MTKPNPFCSFRTHPEIIRLAVMLYVWFPLSLRSVEDLFHEWDVQVSHEPVRYWRHRFGPMFAAEIHDPRRALDAPAWRPGGRFAPPTAGKLAAGSTTVWRVHTCRSKGGRGRCRRFGASNVFKCSPSCMPLSRPTSARSAVNPREISSIGTEPPLSRIGVVFMRSERQRRCPIRDRFEFV